MNREEFDRLVRGVEQGVGRDPAALRRRTLLLALVGYLGLLLWPVLVLLLAIGFFAAAIWGDPGGRAATLAFGVLTLGIGLPLSLRAALVRILPPVGRRVTRAEAPALFAALDGLRTELRSAPFHRVLLTAEFNAGVVQVPRLGALGWSRNHLLLGWPLLEALSPEEMQAVLAHEFTHLSRAHGRTTHWLYRLRRSWEEVFRQLNLPRVGRAGLFRRLTRKFAGWFWPRFNAHAFVLSRANEYEADAQAARLAGPLSMAAALVRLQILGRLVESSLWPEIWRLAQALPAAPDDVMLRLRAGLRAGAGAADRLRFAEQAFSATSTNSDTHPCLRERLAALEDPAVSAAALSSAAIPSAAEALFGPAVDELRLEVGRFWQKRNEAAWRERYARAAALSHRLTALEGSGPVVAVGVEALWDKARALIDLRDDVAVEPILRQILELRADHPDANFQLGRRLLGAGRAEGETHLERAMAANEELVPAACAQLQAYHRQAGHDDRLRELAARLDRHERELAASRLERVEVTGKNNFLVHGLAPPELENLRLALAAEPELARADLAQKELKHFTQQRLYVLCVHRAPAWHRLPDRERSLALAHRLALVVKLPGRVLVVPPTGGFRAVGAKLKRLPGSAVWP
jgi:Zn-dependent protease with chaperone function